MYIRSIALTNFRRFEHFHCEIDRHFTLLVGPNGAGKSSLLKALFVGLSPGFAAIGSQPLLELTDARRVDSLDPGGSSWRTPALPISIHLELGVEGRKDITLVQEFDESGLHTESSDENMAERSQQGRLAMSRLVDRWTNPANSDPACLLARYGAGGVNGVARPGSVQPPFENKRQVWQRALSDLIDATQLAQWFQYNELRTLQEGSAPVAYRVARDAVLTSIHADDVRYVVRDNQLMLRHGEEGWRPFDQLSDGQRRIASVFCDLALRCAAINSHLGEDCLVGSAGVVLIDELDLHLHPTWQRSIIGDLRKVFPKLQFIAASHSPFLLQSAYEYGKVLDVSTGQFVEPTDHSIEDITESVMGVAQPQRGERFLDLKRRAQAFYELLESKPANAEDAARLKAELDQAMAVFANDPASAAWLEQRRIASGH